MWCRWTTYSLLRSILQSEIMGNNFGAKFPTVRTKVESTLTFKNLTPMSKAVIKPCLTANNSALFLEAILTWQEKLTTHFPKWLLITPSLLQYRGYLMSHHLCLVMKKEKEGVATCHAIYLTHVDVLVFPEDMMWKNSKARFKVLWRRWLREFEGGEKILLFQASHNCQRPFAKIKCHGIEEGL